MVFGEEGRVNFRESSLGKVSVVQMAVAALIQWSWEEPSALCAWGMPLVIFCRGSL